MFARMPGLWQPTSPIGLFTLVFLAALSTLTGCTTFQPREAGRAAFGPAIPIPDDQWPARQTDKLEELAAATPKQVFTLVSDGKPHESGPSRIPEPFERLVTEPLAKIFYSGVHGKGILRVIEYAGDQQATAPEHRLPDTTMRFTSYSERKDLPNDQIGRASCRER